MSAPSLLVRAVDSSCPIRTCIRPSRGGQAGRVRAREGSPAGEFSAEYAPFLTAANMRDPPARSAELT